MNSHKLVQRFGLGLLFSSVLILNQPDATFAQSQPQVILVNPPAPQSQGFLTADADSKEIEVNADESQARFTFYITNITASPLVITNLQRSCGCTEATMPSQPWTLQSGESGPIRASIDLRGKAGKISKDLIIQSEAGSKALKLIVNIRSSSSTSGPRMDRARNQQIAAQDRQAIFQGDCAKCHSQPTVGKLGHELYQSGCAICHNAENRAAMVPDLQSLGHPLTAGDWKTWITTSKPGSLMPAFGRQQGGPLTDEQIASLVDYLSRSSKGG